MNYTYLISESFRFGEIENGSIECKYNIMVVEVVRYGGRKEYF